MLVALDSLSPRLRAVQYSASLPTRATLVPSRVRAETREPPVYQRRSGQGRWQGRGERQATEEREFDIHFSIL